MDKKLLIYRRGGLGDTLLTFPVAEAYKKRGWEVHFVGNTDVLPLAVEAGFADRIFSEFPRADTYKKVVLISANKFIEHPDVEWVYPFPPEREHVTRYYLRVLGLDNISLSESLPIKKANDWEGRVVLHPGSGSDKKNPPLELYTKLYHLLDKKGLSPIIVLGVAEYHLWENLKGFETYTVEDIGEFAHLLKGARGFVGNDSGFSHLAGYLGIPTLVLFGPTDPVVWRPLGKNVTVLYKSLECSPCFPALCPHTPPKRCLSFDVEEIFRTLKEKL